MRSLVCLLVLWLGMAPVVWADSPLTSTDFHRAYLDIPEVKEAARTHLLSPELGKFLQNEANPFDVRLAVCNALGWGQNFSSKFLEMAQIGSSLNYNADLAPEIEAKRIIRLFRTPNQAVIFAYLRAMDHYLVEDSLIMPMSICMIAAQQYDNNFAYASIAALIRTNAIMPYQHNWCQMYRLWNKVLSPDEDLNTSRLRPAAINIISEYMELYKEYCNQ